MQPVAISLRMQSFTHKAFGLRVPTPYSCHHAAANRLADYVHAAYLLCASGISSLGGE